MHKAVVFDLDGTLLDTLEDLADAMNQMLREKGLPTHPLEAFRAFVGNGAAMLVTRALPPEMRNEGVLADCLEAFRQIYSHNWRTKTRPYTGIVAMLEALTAQGCPLAVLTNKPQHFAELCVREFFSPGTFTVVHGQRDGFPLKPDPAGPRDIAERLGLSVGDFIYLGDSDVDMMTAVNAGMRPVGAAWGFRSERELRESGAFTVIHRPTELLELMNG